MKLKIIGSSGTVPFPKFGCDCKDCKKAMGKGIPYERISSSLFIYPNILMDTPEEVFRRLMQFGIKELKHVFYTHWHPDHTHGSRMLGMWTRSGFIGKPKKQPIKVYLPVDMIPDFDKYLPSFKFYKKYNFIEVIKIRDRKPITIGKISITPINLKRDDRVRYAFLIEENNKKVMYAPCSVFNTKFDNFWENLDLLFIETGWHGNTKELREKKAESWLGDHISFEENFEWLKKLKPKKMVLTHLEGSIHATYDLIKKEADKYPNVNVAYDGMEIEL